jgi:V/A-type H+-transporting ATPase subunit A
MAGTFWALDYGLSRRRHFPAINWTRSYSLYDLDGWFAGKSAVDWSQLTGEAMALLQRETELLDIVQLVGPDALGETERAVLAVARMMREDFLHQSAYHPVDRWCSLDKTYWMLKTIIHFYHHTQAALDAGVPLEQVTGLPVVAEIARMKELPVNEAEEKLKSLLDRVTLGFTDLGAHTHAERDRQAEPDH